MIITGNTTDIICRIIYRVNTCNRYITNRIYTFADRTCVISTDTARILLCCIDYACVIPILNRRFACLIAYRLNLLWFLDHRQNIHCSCIRNTGCIPCLFLIDICARTCDTTDIRTADHVILVTSGISVRILSRKRLCANIISGNTADITVSEYVSRLLHIILRFLRTTHMFKRAIITVTGNSADIISYNCIAIICKCFSVICSEELLCIIVSIYRCAHTVLDCDTVLCLCIVRLFRSIEIRTQPNNSTNKPAFCFFCNISRIWLLQYSIHSTIILTLRKHDGWRSRRICPKLTHDTADIRLTSHLRSVYELAPFYFCRFAICFRALQLTNDTADIGRTLDIACILVVRILAYDLQILENACCRSIRVSTANRNSCKCTDIIARRCHLHSFQLEILNRSVIRCHKPNRLLRIITLAACRILLPGSTLIRHNRIDPSEYICCLWDCKVPDCVRISYIILSSIQRILCAKLSHWYKCTGNRFRFLIGNIITADLDSISLRIKILSIFHELRPVDILS